MSGAAKPFGHVPVLCDEMLAYMAPRAGGVYLDGTFGGGGYAAALLSAAPCTVWAIDRDPEALARGAALARPGLHMIEGSFGDMTALLAARGVGALDGVVLDLGVSSFQIDDPERGFSFRADGPLDMRMGRSGPTAADLVNRLSEAELADILYRYGEERRSRAIARRIVAARLEGPITTTAALARLIRSVVRMDASGIHPATRSFQALRIRVNDELGEVTRGLTQAAALLRPGGRLVVVSFHSLEDRIVKQFMAERAGRAPGPSRHDPAGLGVTAAPEFRLLTRRAVRPGTAETTANARAASAKLRAIERLEEAA